MSRKLEDIDKKNVHKIPDGYFDALPGVIQSRVAAERASSRRPSVAPSLKWALASIAMLAVGYFVFFRSTSPAATPEELLAQVETQQLIDYLAVSDITTEEIIEGLDPNEVDLVLESTQSDLLNAPDLEELEYFLEDGFEVSEL